MDDKEIIDMYWKRDQKAIYYTTQKYESYCFAIAKNILTCREDSEECVNDTWLTAWNEMPPKKPDILKLFLARITRNSAINRLKAMTAKKRSGKEAAVAEDMIAPQSKQDLEHIAAITENDVLKEMLEHSHPGNCLQYIGHNFDKDYELHLPCHRIAVHHEK